MSSNIQVQRICEYCGKEFIAKTTVTQFCGSVCSKRAYKARIKQVKINKSNNETLKIKAKPIENIKMKEVLSVSDVAILLSCSRRTAYRLINNGTLYATNLGERLTRIRRTEVDKILNVPHHVNPMSDKDKYDISECYNLKEVQEKYGISESALQVLIRRYKIPKTRKGKYAFVPKTRIDSILRST